jgi:4a-hydroxytetrahydrobiopterin dehydratase
MIVPTSDADNSSGTDASQPGAGRGAATSGDGHPWRRRERPLRLERRLEFANYEVLRDFLDRAGELSEETGIYPNLSFGRTYVNMTLFADDDSGELTAEAERFAERVDSLVIPPEVIPPEEDA